MTERKRAEAMFRGLLESAPDAMVIVDDHGRMVLVNAQTERLFGYSRAELLGQAVEMLVPERYRRAHVRHRGEFAGAAHARPMGAGLELFGARKDGSEFPVEISLSPIVSEGRALVASAIRDITDRKQADMERARLIEERAAHVEANRLKDEFIATVSHELRTPLNAVLGWTTLLTEAGLDEDARRRALAAIARNAKAQAQLIEDLLDMSRIVSAKMTLSLEPLDFAEVVEHALGVVRPSADAKGVTLEQIFETRPLLMVGDPHRLQQAVWNLLSNAVKFSGRGGRVQARAWFSGGSIQLTVRDTGRGIAPRFLPFVFDRFRQADSSNTREHGGLGLGLAIVRSIVELHGGTVAAASSGEGHGATFRIELPAKTSRLTPPPAARDASATSCERLDGVRVLVVDDQEDERELLAAILGYRGAQVLTADSVPAAVRAVEDWQPDLLVSDIAMPGEDGYVLLRRIRELGTAGRLLPAIALTVHAGRQDEARAVAAGFHAYLPKPIEPAQLVRTILERLPSRTG